MSPAPSVVVFVQNVHAVSEFYRQLAAMEVLHHDDDHVVLGLPGFELVIHAMRGAEAPARDAAGAVLPREDSYLKVCLPVQSLADSRALAQALGGRLASPDREWEARGFRACDGHDPEGNIVQLRVTTG